MSASGPGVLAAVLAAGKGTRLRSELPKVLHPVAGRPLLDWVLRAARSAGCEEAVVVVGHGAEQVRQGFGDQPVRWVLQQEQRGTGHALAQVESAIDRQGILLVLSGDVPLVSADTLVRLSRAAADGWGALAVADVESPGSLGRVLTREDGSLAAIVEAADASPEELRIRKVNAGIYALPVPEIFHYLHRLQPDNAKGELYLTDALRAAVGDGKSLRLVELEDPTEAWGINDRLDLARVHRKLLRRHADSLMASGVSILDPDGVTIEATVTVGRDTVIHPGVALHGATRIGEGCELEQGVWMRDAQVGDGTRVAAYSVLESATIDESCQIGPFARLRPGSKVAARAKVGNFVEIKDSQLGAGVKANHLAYLGDAVIGEGTNVGAGVITCNYDGKRKSATRIGRNVFVGSDTMLVAPVELGDESMTAAGSVVSKDVPTGALAVERSAQRNVAGWAQRFRKPKRE